MKVAELHVEELGGFGPPGSRGVYEVRVVVRVMAVDARQATADVLARLDVPVDDE